MIKTLILALALIFLPALPATAVGRVVGPDCYFTWDANSETDLAGYRLYVGSTSGIYGPAIDVGNVMTFPCIDAAVTIEGQYYAAVSAYDLAENEGLKSDEVPFVFDATSPEKVLNLGVEKK